MRELCIFEMERKQARKNNEMHACNVYRLIQLCIIYIYMYWFGQRDIKHRRRLIGKSRWQLHALGLVICELGHV